MAFGGLSCLDVVVLYVSALLLVGQDLCVSLPEMMVYSSGCSYSIATEFLSIVRVVLNTTSLNTTSVKVLQKLSLAQYSVRYTDSEVDIG